MNSDTRISVSFLTHRKRKRLRLVLGPGSTDYILDLWLRTAMNRPLGVLHNMDETDIAIDAGWEGNPHEFIQALLDCGFLDRDDNGTFALHDWATHQSYAVHADARSEKASKAAAARWGKQVECPEHTTGIPGAMPLQESSNAPSPTPTPIQKEKKKDAPSAFTFELPDGKVVRLQEPEVLNWEQSYRYIDVRGELRAISDKAPEARAKWTRKNWFGTLSGWLNAANTRAKAANPGLDPDDPSGAKRSTREAEEQAAYMERHGIPKPGPHYSNEDYLHGRVPGCVGTVAMPRIGEVAPDDGVAGIVATMSQRLSASE